MDDQSRNSSSERDNLADLQARYSHLEFAPYRSGMVEKAYSLDFITIIQESYKDWHECLWLCRWGEKDDDGWIPVIYLTSPADSKLFLELFVEPSNEEITLTTCGYHSHLDLHEVVSEFLAVLSEEKVVATQFRGNRMVGSWLANPDDLRHSAEDSSTFQPMGCMMFAKPAKPNKLKIRSWKGTYNNEIDL